MHKGARAMSRAKHKTALELAIDKQQEKLNHLIRLQDLHETPLSKRMEYNTFWSSSNVPGFVRYAKAMEENQAFMAKRLESLVRQNEKLKVKVCKCELAIKHMKQTIRMLGKWLNEARAKLNPDKPEVVSVPALERSIERVVESQDPTKSDDWALLKNNAREAFFKGFYS